MWIWSTYVCLSECVCVWIWALIYSRLKGCSFRWSFLESLGCGGRMETCSGPLQGGWECLFDHEGPPARLWKHNTGTLASVCPLKHRNSCVVVCYYSPVCGDAGEAGSMTAVPSSAMWSWRACLGCSGERGGLRAPLSFPLALRGSFRSRGSSSDSMIADLPPASACKLGVNIHLQYCARKCCWKYLPFHDPTGEEIP